MLGTLHVLAREPEPGRTPREPSRDPPEEIGVSRSPYHAGELAVQRRAGVAASAARIGRGIHDAIPPIARDFLAAQRMLIVGARDREGLAWASPLTGEPGFVRPVDERTVAVDARLEDGDPLAGALAPGAQVGLLAIDLANRSLLSDLLPVQSLRAAGMHLIGSVGAIRRLAMREGLAPSWRPSRGHGNTSRPL